MKLRLKRALKQLLPLTYRSHYQTASGQQRFAVWKMWFNRVYAYDDVAVAHE